MVVLLQTHFIWHTSFTEVANDIIKTNPHIKWETGDHMTHVPFKRYDAVFYIGSFMRLDVARFYRYIWWTNRHIYYGVIEGIPIFDIASIGALNYMEIYVPSKYVYDEITKMNIKVKDIIPHGVDVEAIRNADSSKWRKIFGDKKVLLYVAHRNIRKGFKELIDAWNMTKASKDSNVLLVLHTESKPNTVSGEEWVDFSGNILVTENILKLNKNDLFGLYKAADIYIHPALCEGFGIPIVEAMAAGKPVICLDAPPMNEHVKNKDCLVKVIGQKMYNDRNYIIFRMNIPDLKDMAEKIDWLVYSDKELLFDIGAKNAENAEKYKYENTYVKFGDILT